VRTLEWSPEYGSGPLYVRTGPGGYRADLESLGLPDDLVRRLTEFNAKFADERLPIDGPGDSAWMDLGIRLLHEVRTHLADRYRVVVTEPWWGEDPSEYSDH
jgi:hypothetical protein